MNLCVRSLNARLGSVGTKYCLCNKLSLKGSFIVFKNSKQSCLVSQYIVNKRYFSVNTQVNKSVSFSSTSLLSPGNVFKSQRRDMSLAWLDKLAISQSNWFQSLSKSYFVEKTMDSLQYVHDSLHLPWWLSIILSTVFLRAVITFPLAVYQNYIFAKVETLGLEMNELMKELKRETAFAIKKFKWEEKHTKMMYNRSVQRIWKELIIRENCHPFKASILLWVQIPLWVVLTISFRNMATMMPHNDLNAQVIFIELCSGGFGWLPNLTEVDHSLILPFAMAICNILVVDVNSVRSLSETKRQKYLGYFFKFLCVVLIPIAASVPGNVVLYWTTSSVYGLVQNLILLNPKVKRMCGIPLTPSERKDPYKAVCDILGKKYMFKKGEGKEK